MYYKNYITCFPRCQQKYTKKEDLSLSISINLLSMAAQFPTIVLLFALSILFFAFSHFHSLSNSGADPPADQPAEKFPGRKAAVLKKQEKLNIDKPRIACYYILALRVSPYIIWV